METTMMQVQRELGSITESLRQGEEHRREVMSKLDRHNDKMETMSGQISGLSQSVQSQSAMLQPILLEKCGVRLDAIEKQLEDYETVQFWHHVMGGGMKGLWKLVLAIVSSGSIGAGMVELLHLMWPHTFQ